MSLTTECGTRWSVHPVVLASLLIASCSGDAETPASVDPPSDETAPTTLASPRTSSTAAIRSST